MYQWNFHSVIAHRIAPEYGASPTRHISTQNEAQSMVGGSSLVLQHFIVINQHMGLHWNVEFTNQALIMPKMNFTDISLQSVATQYFNKSIHDSRVFVKRFECLLLVCSVNVKNIVFGGLCGYAQVI